MKFFKPFLLAVAAGMCIGLGGMLNLVCIANDLKILGGILFSIGLLTISLFGFKLFTGQVGYLFAKDDKLAFLKQLGIFYLGNVVGAAGLGYLLRITAVAHNENLMNAALDLAEHKLVALPGHDVGQTFYSIFILSIFCGILVFFAVDIFRRENIPALFRVLGLITAVAAFVIVGFEHCVADMFYLAFSNCFLMKNCAQAYLSILIGSLGNIVGAFAAYYVVKLADSK